MVGAYLLAPLRCAARRSRQAPMECHCMESANQGKKLRIIPAMHPVRIMRPDNVKRRWIIISQPEQRISIKRHWNKELSCTEPCTCEPACHSSRDDYFTGALFLMPQPTPGDNVAEQVVLHCTEQTARSIYNLLRIHGDDGDLAGCLVCLQRVGGGNGRVQVVSVERAKLTHQCPRIDVGGVLNTRMRLSVDFFGRRFDSDEEHPSTNQVIPPARSRSDKPRVDKGGG